MKAGMHKAGLYRIRRSLLKYRPNSVYFSNFTLDGCEIIEIF